MVALEVLAASMTCSVDAHRGSSGSDTGGVYPRRGLDHERDMLNSCLRYDDPGPIPPPPPSATTGQSDHDEHEFDLGEPDEEQVLDRGTLPEGLEYLGQYPTVQAYLRAQLEPEIARGARGSSITSTGAPSSDVLKRMAAGSSPRVATSTRSDRGELRPRWRRQPGDHGPRP